MFRSLALGCCSHCRFLMGSPVLVQPKTAPAAQETRPGLRLQGVGCLLRADTWTPLTSPAPAGPLMPPPAAGTEPPTRQAGMSSCRRRGMVPVMLPAPAALPLLQVAGAKALPREAKASPPILLRRRGSTIPGMLPAPAAALQVPQPAGAKALTRRAVASPVISWILFLSKWR